MPVLQYDTNSLLTLACGETTFRFHPTGDVFEFLCGGIMINGYQGTARGGSINNIYLRVYAHEDVAVYPLLGVAAGGAVSIDGSTLRQEGMQGGIRYCVDFRLAEEGLWFWDVTVWGDGQEYDLVFAQDLGMAAKGGVLTNELYAAQYLGHSVFSGENGYTVCSRQNQMQGGAFPYLQLGTLHGNAIHYSTDAMQLYGMSYKATTVLEALRGDLADRNYQFEFPVISLQTAKATATADGYRAATFYGVFQADHPDKITCPLPLQPIAEAFAHLVPPCVDSVAPVQLSPEIGERYCSPEMSAAQLDALYPGRRLEETEGGALLSFFTDTHEHVVLQRKELLVERPHGTILTTQMAVDRLDNNLITTSCYMYGLFNGQTVAGNTSFHKLISTPRGLLNVLPTGGQRIYVKLDGQYRLLTLPAAFEMGMNYARWVYLLPDDQLIVTVFAATERPDIVMQAETSGGTCYDFLITNQLVMGEHEYLHELELESASDGGEVRLRPSAEFRQNSPYPELCYAISARPAPKFTDDRVFFADGQTRDETLLTLCIDGASRFTMTMRGRIHGFEDGESAAPVYSFEDEKVRAQAFYEKLLGGFHLEMPTPSGNADWAEKLNTSARWYAHNALVHFAVPHGLEQPGGAAWGTRDVCQGPMEFFLTTQMYPLARATLCRLFAHQSPESGEWPQWFMFDGYAMHAGERHGDVVFWPIKAVADYLQETGDTSILSEMLPYTDEESARPVELCESLLAHCRRAFAAIQARFIGDSGLITYAGGDWDDTLQPASEEMKERLVSAWTVALAYQTMDSLSRALQAVDGVFAAELADTARRVRDAFTDQLIRDGIPAGFARIEEDGGLTYLLHPRDETTGIHYRLLPLTRSIIAEMVVPEQAQRQVQVIDEKLACPDGVRLMERPARYDGGVSTLFRRAEQAANVGREISLQYVHAHIRYIEAMAKLGEAGRAFEALFTVNPVGIHDAVSNAARRQSNLYFSSSEGAFYDRYEYAEQFDRLKDGSIPVKGGWRLYSSGSGIYLRQLIAHLLGIRFAGEDVIVDPVLPAKCDGLRFTYCCFEREMTFVYHIASDQPSEVRLERDGGVLATCALHNTYRSAGVTVDRGELLRGGEEIHIFR